MIQTTPMINEAVPNATQYYPLTKPDIGTPVAANKNTEKTLLFEPITFRDVTFKNRIWVPAMVQASADDGHATDWHLVHLGTFATRGAGAIVTEASAVLPEGRISPEDLGIWKDSQIGPLKRIVSFSQAHGTRIGIQLSHAGRKASVRAPWVRARAGKGSHFMANKEENGWPDEVYAPSQISFVKGSYADPKEMTEEHLNTVVDAFVESTKRADRAGFDFIELQAGHGYLLHQFLSPLSNTRNDIYGGSLENRFRFTLRVVEKVREAWPSQKPLFVRLSTVEWAEGPEKDVDGKWLQWGIEQSIILGMKLQELGVDLISSTTGGNWAAQRISVGPGYQLPPAAALKKALPNLAVGNAGMITEAEQAESYLQQGKIDVVFMARELLRNPSWPMYAAQQLGVRLKPANQYEMAWPAPNPVSRAHA